MYSPSQNRPRTECIQNTKHITYYKMYCAPICIPQPRAGLNSKMQKRLSCSYRLVSRSLNPPVSLSAFTPFSCFCFSSYLLDQYCHCSCSYRLVSRSSSLVSLWQLHTFCPIFCWCHISKETGPCQTGRALLVVICCKLSSASVILPKSVYRIKLKLELWSRSKAQSTMACRHPCYQALAIKAYSNLPYCLFAFMPRFLFGHFFLLRLQLSLTYWVQIRKDMFENSYKLPNGPYLMQTSSYMYGMILDKGPCLTWKSSS